MSPRYCPLFEQACIEVRGADAAAFLHGQLSRTVETLDEAFAPLAGWHDAKGRLRALVRVVRQPDRWLLLLPRDVATSTANRLRMFVLRAKVQIEVSDLWASTALLGADDTWLEAHGLASDTPSGGVVARDGTCWIRVGPRLWHRLGAATASASFDPALAEASSGDAALAEIELGLPSIGAPLVEHFVPQMLNLDLLDAVSFDKGCYPGQEVITRVHHRGSVKRRMRRYACAAAQVPAPGAEVAGPGGAAGEVVRAAPASPDAIELLAVVDHAAAGGALSVAGAALRELPLPYTVPND
jgi:folate-binding protein YgfZ